ncbi:MAG: monovalent cation/H+ antiporter subunit A [Rhizobiaceae bacterium]|nr:monovalent cation/H+ antiporter subunit A [Rhizobiaceae bacterium]
MWHSGLLVVLVALPFAGAVLASLLSPNARNAEAWLAGTVTAVALLITATAYTSVTDGEVIRHSVQWVPTLGLTITLRMDGFAWLFAVLITGIGLLIVIYARYYMSPQDPIGRFYAYLLAFMGSMLGLVLSGNLILLAIFWELTSIFSFLLIGYWHHNQSARDGARMALTITGAGGLCLLVGMVMLGQMAGSYDLDKVLAAGDVIRSHHLYVPTLLLILAGALTKSAQFPFHFWLPNAMTAPTPVSAYLHSATMVKAGVFLLTRFWPVLSGTPEWFTLVGIAGLTTLLLGAYFAIFQHDMKGLLAYSTISHLGLITSLLSFGSPLSAVAAIFHMLNHATFKASLFMAVGIIDHETGTRDMRRLSGLFSALPYTATLAMVASASMAGVPLLNGFLSKEMFFAEAIEEHQYSLLDRAAPYVATIAGAFAVAYSIRFIHTVFFGPKAKDLPQEPHEPQRWMRRPVELLVILCVIVGIVPAMSIGPFLHTGVIAVLGERTPEYSLSIWHGFNIPMLMSVVAMIGGGLLYWRLRKYLQVCEEGPPYFRRLKGQRIFERILITVSWRWARTVESVLATRKLQPQMRLLVVSALLAGVWAMWGSGDVLPELSLHGLDPVLGVLWAIGAFCAVAAAYQAKFHRLAALILMSGTGIATCLSFVWLSAPDLAVTQLLVEIVTTVLILLGLRWLPKRSPEISKRIDGTTRLRRHRDFALAVAAGLGTAVLAYFMMLTSPPSSVGDFYLNNAYSQGGGTNVVNVILVDFRGFDTMGEIVVLAIVGLTVFSLLRRFRPAEDNKGLPYQQKEQEEFDSVRRDREQGETLQDYLLVPSVIMRWMFPVIILLAAYLFVRGHDMPGGGFAAGITMAIGFLLQYLAGGTRWVEDRLRILPVRWIGTGLLIAALTGAGSFVFGYPFLTSYFQYTEIPYIGKMPTASALLFDLGVFSLVVGATVLILIAIAHQTLRIRSRAVRASGDGGHG